MPASQCVCFAAVLLWLAGPASAQPGPFCRLDATPWLGCATTGGVGAACTCAALDHGGRGHVAGADRERPITVADESAKHELRLDWLSGPVIAFVPKDLIERRSLAVTAEQKRLLDIYDLVLRRNWASLGPTAVPTLTPPTAAPAPTSPEQAAPASPEPAAPALPAPVTPALALPIAPLYPVRVFLQGKDVPPPGLGAYGVVALKAKPTSASAARLAMLCQSFLASLPPQSSLPAGTPLSAQMVTFWPVDDRPVPAAAECPTLLDHYDLWAGQSAIHDAAAQGNDVSGRGPFLIGWSPSTSRLRPDAIVLVVDLSQFEAQASFDEALLFWQRKVVEDPALWRSGFSVTGLRLAMRDFADHYGSDILKAIHLTGD